MISPPNLTFSNGDIFPTLGLGTWKSAPGEVARALEIALELGYRHFDCAAIYGNEREIGEAFAATSVPREELFITSKLWNNRHLSQDVRRGAEQSLTDLQLDYLDLYLMHWPIACKPDVHFPEHGDDFLAIEEAPISGTWRAIEELQKTGLVRHIGVSNFNPKKLREICSSADHAPEVNQVECHPFLSQEELLETCNELGVLLTAYSPLGSPGSAGAESDVSLLDHAELHKIAAQHGATTAQIALAWAIARGTAVIPKSTNPQRLKTNLSAASIKLSTKEMEDIDQLNRNHRFIDGSVWCVEGSPYSLDWLWNS